MLRFVDRCSRFWMEASIDVSNTHTPSRASVVVDRCSCLWMEASGDAFNTRTPSHASVAVDRCSRLWMEASKRCLHYPHTKSCCGLLIEVHVYGWRRQREAFITHTHSPASVVVHALITHTPSHASVC